MKQEFSKSWKASKRPGKQRKYAANAPLHIKKKFASVNLSKELRQKYGTRNVPLRKGDTVKVMRGKFKGKQGKIIDMKLKILKVYIEGIQVKKRDGSKANIRFQPSNLQIIELNLDDKKRNKKFTDENKTKVKESAKKQKETKSGEKE
jgi:large subunit ribosomal protein L24